MTEQLPAHAPEEANQPVPQSPGHKSDLPTADFGANEWLVEEMHDQYKQDPGSVDPTWVHLLQDAPDPTLSVSNGSNGAPQGRPETERPASVTP